MLDNPYGDKGLTQYPNAAAFALPATGTLGNHVRNSIEGPGFWTVDLAATRHVSIAATRTLELRVEVFHLFNNFNGAAEHELRWGHVRPDHVPQTGDPRIMRFGMKYGF